MSSSPSGLYPALLGASWGTLARSVQLLHGSSVRAEGTFSVRRGAGRGARILARLLGMPGATERVAISLQVQRSADGERWIRTFGSHPLSTSQWRRGSLLVEAMGLTQCWFRLVAAEGALVFEQVKASFGLRRFWLPLPRLLAPQIAGRAEPRAGTVHVSVQIGVPLFGLLVAYEGHVTVEVDA